MLCVTLLIALGTLGLWRVLEQRREAACFIVGQSTETTCVVIIPEEATQDEQRAAALLSETLSVCLEHRVSFPITSARHYEASGRSIMVGAIRATEAEMNLQATDGLLRPVGYKIAPRTITIRAAHREDVVHAVSLFLEDAVHARWFMPGRMGQEVAQTKVLRLKPRMRIEAGKYYSRNLSGAAPGAVGDMWFSANRLNSLFTHGHTLSQLATPDDLQKLPEFAPWLEDRRFVPRPDGVVNWQPDLLAPGLLEFVSAKVAAAFRSAARPISFAVGQNDTYRFDQSERTLAVLRPERYYRDRPDYADLLFTFLNRVAVSAAREFPDRVLTTYAYDWTENTPSFPVAANIVPFLTADRSGWFDPNFAADDRALIARWGRSGVRFFALYDYLYGSPFVVPRPTVWAVTEPIPYGYAQGARGYFAEMTPNWALDGPKPWIAAQLLWNPGLDSGKLLDEYYTRFWRETAVPMRAFYELCDRQWWKQSKPAVWDKYYRDEDQRHLFPPAIRVQLRALLHEARRLARTKRVCERVDLVSEAFNVADLFCAHGEANERLARLAFAADTSPADLIVAWREYTAAREALLSAFTSLKRDRPLAMQTPNLNDYLRNDPRQRVARTLAKRGLLAAIPAAELESLFLGRAPTSQHLTASGRELVVDSEFRTLALKSRPPFFLTDWVESGPWGGKSEPREHRRIELLPNPDGSRRLRYSGCNQETLWQWVEAKPGSLYRATVRARGHISSGNMVYLLVSMLDRNNKHVDPGHTDRLPAGEWPEWVPLEIVIRAPADAHLISVNLRTLYQVPGDWMEWELLSLREIPE